MSVDLDFHLDLDAEDKTKLKALSTGGKYPREIRGGSLGGCQESRSLAHLQACTYKHHLKALDLRFDLAVFLGLDKEQDLACTRTCPGT